MPNPKHNSEGKRIIQSAKHATDGKRGKSRVNIVMVLVLHLFGQENVVFVVIG